MSKHNLHKYKIIFKAKYNYDSIDYVFLAVNDHDAERYIEPFTNLYTIDHVWRYNRDIQRYEPVKALEDKYVKAT